MLDLAVAYSRYRFLGDEFLTWLWYIIDSEPVMLGRIDPDCVSLEIGSRIVLENRTGKSVERITINGDDAGLEEGRVALQKGALVTEFSLVFKTAEQIWNFNIKGESLNFSNIKTPGPHLPQSEEELELFLNEKTVFLEKIFNFIDNLYKSFLKIRVSAAWNTKQLPAVKKWIMARSEG
jgi:hypothetical protein